MTVVLDLSDFGPGFAAAEIETLADARDARQPDVMNHWTAPDRVSSRKCPADAGPLALPALSITAVECRRK